ncbi:hypothetical protein HY404_01285 [Candidatus Microgenomates bacterium]|nr:hypothetical protein [Candidatus Microgenomates bacterium]
MIVKWLTKFWVPILLIFISLLASRDLLLPGYFPMHDDLQMMRQLQLEKCFKDLQIPCRWVPDMGYGYGFPLFNYYPPLPYLVGQVFRLVGFHFTEVAKIIFLLSIMLSGFTMYLLAKEFWGRFGGVVSATFYIWAPYHALDVFVRGAMNESWALVWFPLLLWSTYKLIVSTSPAPAKRDHPSSILKWVMILALAWAALLLSHNIMVLIFTPVLAVWSLWWLWRTGKFNKVPMLAIGGIWGIGLAAFFTLPVFFEKNLVHVETLTQGYYEYIAHFATFKQLFFSRFWGYGASVWMDGDGMAFPVGHVHWILALVIVVLTIASIIFKKKKKFNLNLVALVGFLLVVGIGAAFMAHSRSTPIWLTFPFLSIVQFPWRFLTLTIFSLSFLAGALVVLLAPLRVIGKAIISALLIFLIIFNFNFFRVERTGPVTDQEKFSGEAWRLQQTAGIYDYLPKGARIAPQSARKEPLEIDSGKAEFSQTKEGTNWLKTNIKVNSDNATVVVNIFNFPNWKAWIDGKKTEIKVLPKDDLARISLLVPQGDHKLEVRLTNTPIRTVGNMISLISWFILLRILWKRKHSFKLSHVK